MTQVTAVHSRYLKAYCAVYDELWQASTGPGKFDAYWCYVYRRTTKLTEAMILVTPELCRRYSALILPDLGTRQRVLALHFPGLADPTAGRQKEGKKTGVTEPQPSVGGCCALRPLLRART